MDEWMCEYECGRPFQHRRSGGCSSLDVADDLLGTELLVCTMITDPNPTRRW